MDYKQIRVQIDILKVDLKTIEMTGVSAINYNTSSQAITSNKAEAKKTKEYKAEIEQTIFILERKLAIIDKAMGILNTIQRELITKKLIEDEPYYKVCGDLHVGERYARKIKKKAILRMQEVMSKDEYK